MATFSITGLISAAEAKKGVGMTEVYAQAAKVHSINAPSMFETIAQQNNVPRGMACAQVGTPDKPFALASFFRM